MRATRKRRGYSSRRTSGGYRQPSLYSRTEESKAPRGTHFPISLLVILALGGLVYMVFFSGLFSVNEVTFSSTRFINRGELTSRLAEGKTFLDNNIITFGLFGLQGRLTKVTGVEKVTLKHLSQHKVLIMIEEKSPLFVWQTLGSKYLVDDEGIAWAVYQDKYASLPIVNDTKNVPIALGSKVVPANFMAFYRDLQTNFTLATAAKITKLEVMDIVSDLKVTTDGGWYVYFDTNHLAKSQINNLMRVLGQVQGSKTKLEYVDLRIENRIFYK